MTSKASRQIIRGILGTVALTALWTLPALAGAVKYDSNKEVQGSYNSADMNQTAQMSNSALQQSMTQGQIADGQNQAQTYQLLQQMAAEATNSLSPGIQLCQFGTQARSLASSEGKAMLNAAVLNENRAERDQLSGARAASFTSSVETQARISNFKKNNCDVEQNDRGGLKALCENSAPAARRDKDIDYPRSVDMRLGLDADFTNSTVTDDENDIMALSHLLYATKAPENIPLQNLDPDANEDASHVLLNGRAVAATRSVAYNTFANVVALRTQGTEGSEKFIHNVYKSLGISEDDAKKLVGEKPSYHAQMETLTKKLYQNPTFYVNLIDKPENAVRSSASMHAIMLMQDRDLYKSLLRREMLLSQLVEIKLRKIQDDVNNSINAHTDSYE